MALGAYFQLCSQLRWPAAVSLKYYITDTHSEQRLGPGGIGWGDGIRTAVGSSPIPSMRNLWLGMCISCSSRRACPVPSGIRLKIQADSNTRQRNKVAYRDGEPWATYVGSRSGARSYHRSITGVNIIRSSAFTTEWTSIAFDSSMPSLNSLPKNSHHRFALGVLLPGSRSRGKKRRKGRRTGREKRRGPGGGGVVIRRTLA